LTRSGKARWRGASKAQTPRTMHKIKGQTDKACSVAAASDPIPDVGPVHRFVGD
jgi:hypothetical protein